MAPLQRNMYWQDAEFKSPEVYEVMSHRRFKRIEENMCLYSESEVKTTGEANPESKNYDPNYKVMGCWRACLLSAQDNKNPSLEMAIDECIIAFGVGLYCAIDEHTNNCNNHHTQTTAIVITHTNNCEKESRTH